MTYRIVNENGYVDFAPDLSTAKKKLTYYNWLVQEGYCKWAKIIEVDPQTGKEKEV